MIIDGLLVDAFLDFADAVIADNLEAWQHATNDFVFAILGVRISTSDSTQALRACIRICFFEQHQHLVGLTLTDEWLCVVFVVQMNGIG